MALTWVGGPIHTLPLVSLYNIKVVVFKAGALWCLPVPGSQDLHAEVCRES